ncbi:MAG: hypothetical protein IJ211_00485 [Campylobacter sp.]|nr:hypothetical protein [Campylobacter sp.]
MRKIILICIVFVFCLTGCIGSKQPQKNLNYCDDLYIKGEIAKMIMDNQNIDEEIEIKNVFCENNMIVMQFDIDVDRTEKILMKASQKDFNKGISDDLSQYYCTDGDLKLYRKRNMLFKWQYFFKGENEPYGEFIANNDICK